MKKLKENFFKDANCIVVYDLLLKKENISIAQILSKLNDEKQKKWFSKVALINEQIATKCSKDNENSLENYETFNVLYKDIELERQKKERKILEKEVLLMSEGKKEIDNSKIEKYRQLTAQIKGSRKK